MKLIPGVRMTFGPGRPDGGATFDALPVGRRRRGLEDDVIGDEGERGVKVAAAEGRVERHQGPMVGTPSVTNRRSTFGTGNLRRPGSPLLSIVVFEGRRRALPGS